MPCVSVDEVRRDEDEERRQSDEGEAAGNPPPVADEPGEPHDDQHGEREEHELRAESQPAAEQELPVVDLRHAVPPVPPVAGHGERHRHEPDEAEAEHRQQHPRADAPGRRLAHETHSLHGVDAEHDEQHHGRQQPVDPVEELVVVGLVELALREERVLRQVRDGQVRRHARLPEQPRCHDPDACGDE